MSGQSSNSAALEDLLSRAVALHRQGALPQAQALYEKILKHDPAHFDAFNLLGLVAYQTGDFQKAVALFDRAIALHGGNPVFHSHRGLALHGLGRWDDAVAGYDRALALKPDYADAFNNRGITRLAQQRLNDALADFDRAVALNPAYADAHYNRGIALQELKRTAEAVASYDQAIRLRPGDPRAHNNRAVALHGLKRLDEALAGYGRALALDPHIDYLPGNWLFTRLKVCQWDNLAADIAAVTAGIEQEKKAAAPFHVLAMTESLPVQRKAAEIWQRDKHPPSTLPPLAAYPERAKVRVGYYSADFHDHATAYLMAELFERHDRDRFEITAFSFGPDTGDAMRRRLMAAFDAFIDVRDASDAHVAQQSRAMQIDIAVDLKGFTDDHRMGIFLHRAAPLQVSYLGYPGTTGTPAMDYMIADAAVVPPQHRAQYTEKIVYLPDTYQVNDGRRAISSKHFSRQELGLPAQGFVFCCFNASFKINPPVFESWMRILRRVPDSVLWLYEDNTSAARNLRKEAAARGVAAERLVFARYMPLAEHLARHRAADLFLDTLPYNAHTTASDALWTGLPVITRPGESFAGRVAASLLQAVGLPELIAGTPEQYEALAVDLARDPARLQEIRRKLALNRGSAPLFDAARFTAHVEAAYLYMYRRQHAGLPPEDVRIPP